MRKKETKKEPEKEYEPLNNVTPDPDDDITTVSIQNDIGRLFVLPDNAQHIGLREQQQDYFAYSDLFDMEKILKYGYVAVMADGMGGMQSGRDAAITGVDAFLNAYYSSIDRELSVNEALAVSLEAANDAVAEYEGAGSTLIGAVVQNNALSWISVGDSHLYLYRKGLLRKLNTDHVYAAELDELCRQGKISAIDAANHPERKALTSYLGLPEISIADYNDSPYPLLPGDIILLCSDGLYGVISEDEITKIISENKEDISDKLIHAALLKQHPHQDNVTAVLLKII